MTSLYGRGTETDMRERRSNMIQITSGVQETWALLYPSHTINGYINQLRFLFLFLIRRVNHPHLSFLITVVTNKQHFPI